MGIFKKVAGKVVDTRVDRWMSWGYIRETTDRFKVLFLDIVIPKKASTSETFEEAMQRLELTEADLALRKKEFTRLFYFFIVLAVIILAYALFMAYRGSLVTALIAFCLSVYALSQAFRFHFWLFQLKHRKLGCTIKEWMNSSLIDRPEEVTKNHLPTKRSNQNVKTHASQEKG